MSCDNDIDWALRLGTPLKLLIIGRIKKASHLVLETRKCSL